MSEPGTIPGEAAAAESAFDELIDAQCPRGVHPEKWRAETDEAIERLKTPAREMKASGGLLLITLVLFFVLNGGMSNLSETVLLIAIIFVHELGHLAAMKLMGFTDTRIFFIPF